MGKSPMKTVWLLISPVVLLVNSAVTNSGAAYVMSLSLHSSTEYLVGSNRWSRKLSDIEPEKSSIGEISSKISSRPELVDRSVRPASMPSWTRDCQASLPTSQSNDVVCRCRRFGTSRGSRIFANETRDVLAGAGTAKGRSFRRQLHRLPRRSDWRRHTRPTGRTYGPRGYMTGGSATRQHSRREHPCRTPVVVERPGARGGQLHPPAS